MYGVFISLSRFTTRAQVESALSTYKNAAGRMECRGVGFGYSFDPARCQLQLGTNASNSMGQKHVVPKEVIRHVLTKLPGSSEGMHWQS